MFRSLKMRFMCGITAAAVLLSIAYPYNGHVYSMVIPAGYNLALLPIRQKRRGGE